MYDSPTRLINIGQMYGYSLSEREAEFLLQFFTAILQTTNEGAIEYLRKLMDSPLATAETEPSSRHERKPGALA